MYCIVDIETTGGSQKSGKITEIAGFLHDGHKIIDKFSTLVNPGIPIPPFITNLTGISNRMVADAPPFEEIADSLERFTANAVFVAHNVNFDYGFIREEFRNIGREFSRKKLCTVHLSRKSFPGLESYSLGKISAQLNIELLGHHRAEADARATVDLFEKIIDKNSQKGLFDVQFGLNDIAKMQSPLIDFELLNGIPDDCGIFKLYNQADELLYVKRSNELLTALCTKLTPNGTTDSNALISETYRIDWDATGSALLAQLLEAHEVISHQPIYNHGKFSLKSHFGLFLKESERDVKIELRKRRKNDHPEMAFGNFYEGLDYLKSVSDNMGLEITMNPNDKSIPPHITIEGGELSEEVYSKIFPNKNYFVVDEGHIASERCLIMVEEGAVVGAGYYDMESTENHLEPDSMPIKFGHLPELEMILRKFIDKKRFEKIVPR